MKERKRAVLAFIVIVVIAAVGGVGFGIVTLAWLSPDGGTLVSKYHEDAWTETRASCNDDGSCTMRIIHHEEEWRLKIDDDGDGEAGWLDWVDVPRLDWESCERNEHWQADRLEGCAR